MTALSKQDVNASLLDLRTNKAFLDLIEVATVVAAGSTNADATLLTGSTNAVTAADGTKGVILPQGKKDKQVEVINTVSNQALKVYPDAGGQINALTATTGAFSQTGGGRAIYVCDADLHWYVADNALSTAELAVLDGVTPGTAAASKAVVLGASKDIATITSATITTLTSTTVNTAALVASAGVTSSGPTGAGIGYATGAGGSVIQTTSRSTGVTLSKLSGTIQTDTSSLAAEASADFIVTNTTVAIGDVVVVAIQSGSNGGGTIVSVSTVTAGTFTIRVHNGNAAAGTAETGAIIINFAVIKAVAA